MVDDFVTFVILSRYSTLLPPPPRPPAPFVFSIFRESNVLLYRQWQHRGRPILCRQIDPPPPPTRPSLS